jgi:rRNA pseudouridine-1189 N-methylase Emg1 (Nep1/Mra1 family)
MRKKFIINFFHFIFLLEKLLGQKEIRPKLEPLIQLEKLEAER